MPVNHQIEVSPNPRGTRKRRLTRNSRGTIGSSTMGTRFLIRAPTVRALGPARTARRCSGRFRGNSGHRAGGSKTTLMTHRVISPALIIALRKVQPFSDLACSSSLAPLASFYRWRGRSTAGPSHQRTFSALFDHLGIAPNVVASDCHAGLDVDEDSSPCWRGVLSSNTPQTRLPEAAWHRESPGPLRTFH
jgi:hypothetical protein